MKLNSSIVQVIIIGCLAFCGPGLFNALNGLGAVGSGDVKVAAVTNGCLYATFSIVGYFAGSIFNVIGPKASFSFGAATYAIYALCVYFSEVHIAIPAIGGFLLGCGAGLFWCAQMALCLAYSTKHNASRMMSLFWIIFNLGGVFGGFLQMGMNFPNLSLEKGGLYGTEGLKANDASYFTFIAIMGLAVILPWILLSNPNTVIKEDGSVVKVKQAESFKKELKDAARGITDPFVLRMFVYFLFSNWFYTYEFNYLNGYYFNSRAQGMNSGLYWAAQMLGASILPFIVDNQKFSMKKKIWGGLILNIVFLVISWTLAFIVQYTSCNGSVDKARSDIGVLDLQTALINDYRSPSVAWVPDFKEIDLVKEYEEIQGTDLTELKEWNDLSMGEKRCFAYNSLSMQNSNGFDVGFPKCAYSKKIVNFWTTWSGAEAKANVGETAKCSLDISQGDENYICSNTRNVLLTGQNEHGHEFNLIFNYVGALPENASEDNPFDTDFEERVKIANAFKIEKDSEFDPEGTVIFDIDIDQALENFGITEISDEVMTDILTLSITTVPYVLQGEYKENSMEYLLIKGMICSRNLGTDEGAGSECKVQWKTASFSEKTCLKVDSSSFTKESALIIVDYIFMGISDAIFQCFSVWLIGSAAGGDLSLSARYAAAYKGIQSLGAAVAWLSDMSETFTYRIQAFICVAFGAIAIIGVILSVDLICEKNKTVVVTSAVDDDVKSAIDNDDKKDIDSSSSSVSSEEKVIEGEKL